ncbi:MAG TPA: hypothetical protein VLA45_18710 [Paracoccaceae bacterium]|nr:hypothetical protein [Paracoccaceae bacterium]
MPVLRARRMILPLVAAGLFSAMPATAQDYANESGEQERAEREARIDNDRIVVTGRAEEASRAEVHMLARDITMAGSVRQEPLARFQDPLCPGIAGLTAEVAGLVIDRIRENAGLVDLAVQDDGCTPNFIVAVVEDGQAMLARMIEQSPGRFQYMDSVDKRRMLEPGPVHVWTDVLPMTLTGMPIPRVRDLVEPPIMSAWVSHSLISTSVRNDIGMVWVFLDREEVRALSLRQLADYATMRGLVQTDPPAETGISTILGLFNENGPWPEELTDFDRAYLAAVYEPIANMPAAYNIGRVAAELRAIEEGRAKE